MNLQQLTNEHFLSDIKALNETIEAQAAEIASLNAQIEQQTNEIKSLRNELRVLNLPEAQSQGNWTLYDKNNKITKLRGLLHEWVEYAQSSYDIDQLESEKGKAILYQTIEALK